jgi:hypothetical protein
MIPEAARIQLRHRPPEDEQDNARNMQRILINVLYVNKNFVHQVGNQPRSRLVLGVHCDSILKMGSCVTEK